MGKQKQPRTSVPTRPPVRVAIRTQDGPAEVVWASPLNARKLGGTYTIDNACFTVPFTAGDVVRAETRKGQLHVVELVSRGPTTGYVLTCAMEKYAETEKHFRVWGEYALIESSSGPVGPLAALASYHAEPEAPGPADFTALVRSGHLVDWKQTTYPEDTTEDLARVIDFDPK